uniref:RNA helicase n=2 Tax=Acrobeloides nanus TaxID=290746 RepID=A0A914EAX5_9BILA
MSNETAPNSSNGTTIPAQTNDSDLAATFATDDKPIPKEESSLLNKILNEKLNSLNEGIVEISKQQLDPASPLYSNQTFESLRLKQPLIDALYQMGFQQPSKIQEAALPLLLCEPPQDMIAQAQSGTGKTATFLLTMLNRLDPEKKFPQCICLAPTYELARQIGEVAKKMAKNMPEIQIRYAIKGENVSRGMPIAEQIVIGTPGKMLDWVVKFRLIDPSKIICFVLDEADIMISQQGYQDQSIRLHNQIIAAAPNCQCMLFSATFSEAVFNFANQMISDPVIITVRRQDQTLPNIKQYFVRCRDRSDKYRAISNLYCSLTIASSIIFCYTRSSATWLANQLRATGRDVALLHGDMAVMERAQAVEDFKNGKYKVMITTNVCARGLDIPQVALIVNYDPPVTFEEHPQPDYDTYLHRIGRTGRFGKPGIAVNLADSDITMSFVKSFETYFGRPIEPLDDRDMDQLDKIEKETQ